MKELINQRDAEDRRHGFWEWYWLNGTLMGRGHYHHGKAHGVCEWYRPDGTLRSIGRRHHGEQKGLETEWASQGRIIDKTYHLVIR